MALSLNEVTIMGRVGKDPEIRSVGSGRLANLTIACSEGYKDKTTGEWKEKTEWIPVTVWDERTVDMIDRNVKKGMLLWVRGRYETRSYKSNNDEKNTYVTECVVRPYSGSIRIDYAKKSDDGGAFASKGDSAPVRGGAANASASSKPYDLEDDIPF